MPTIGTTSKPAYVYDAGTDTWIPVGVGAHTHSLTSADVSGVVAQSGYFASGKNKIINGDFGVWQRGTSFAGNVYTADRWTTQTNKTLAVSRQAFTAGDAPVLGYESTFFLRQTYSADGSYGALQTKLEDVRLFAGQTITLSYWAKADATYSNTPSINQNFGSGGSTGVTTNGTTHSITTTWNRYSSVITVPSISGKTIGTNSFFLVQPILIESSGARTIDIWGIQIEASAVATAFQTATGNPASELAACQRYYEKSYAQATSIQTNTTVNRVNVANHFNSATGISSATIFLKVTKRSTPTITLYRGDGSATNPNYWEYTIGTNEVYANPTVANIGDNNFSVGFNGTASGGTANNATLIRGHYTAEAEL